MEVDSDGTYLTHDVSSRSHRSRRSLSTSLHYRLSAFGQNMHLDLHPSSIVGPGFTVQIVDSHGISTVMDDERFHHCLYQGFIRNLSASSAAISTCSGLVRLCIPEVTVASELIILLWFLHNLEVLLDLKLTTH